MLQEIYAEDPNADQPQWVKPRRVKSSSFHRVKTPGDVTKIQVQYCRTITTNRKRPKSTRFFEYDWTFSGLFLIIQNVHILLLWSSLPHVMRCCILFFYSVSQAFIAAEVLKLYGLTKDQSQKTDWQKMLKFGRKKRDRVDHILVGAKSPCLWWGAAESYYGLHFSVTRTDYLTHVCTSLKFESSVWPDLDFCFG